MALTPEELRQRISTWSLESDGQLLQYMISIAKNLEEKCTTTRDNLNRLMLQVNQTELNLSTATNQFSAVEQVKFVENRVEEDDESFYGLRRRRQQQHQQQQVTDGNEGTKQEPDAERSFDDLIQLAVERSIEGMYKSYETVTLQLTDSDTSDGEDASESTIRRADAELSGGKASVMRAVPRHPFIDRPLPHVIGSKEWQNKWHVGLIDSDDESSSDRKEEYSETNSSDTDDGGMFPSQPNSKNHTPSESESSIWGTEVGHKRAPSIDPSITGDDGSSSVYSYASSSKPRTIAAATLPVRGMASALKPPGLFPEEPPEVIENKTLRRSDRGLFDESPGEEQDAEEPTPTPTPRQTVSASNVPAPFFKGTSNKPTRKLVNLFDDEPPSPQEPRIHAPEPVKKAINLFIESDDEEVTKDNVRNNNVRVEDGAERTMTSKSSNVARHAGPATANLRTMNKLVDELNNNFRKQQPEPLSGTVVESRKPERSVASNLFDSEPPADDFDQLFNAANTPALGASSRNALPQPATRTIDKKTVNLFADDDEDDYDGIVVGSIEQQPEPTRSPFVSPNRHIALPVQQPERLPGVPASKKKSIFDESDSDAEKDHAASGVLAGLKRNQTASEKRPSVSVVPQPPKAITKSIFSDSSEEEDDDAALFGHSSNVVKSKLDALKRNGPSAAAWHVQPAVTNTDRTEKQYHQPTDKAKKSLFDEDSDDDGADPLFSSGLLGTTPIASGPVYAPQRKEPAKVSLFDDESNNEDDLQYNRLAPGVIAPSRNSYASKQIPPDGDAELAMKQTNPSNGSDINASTLTNNNLVRQTTTSSKTNNSDSLEVTTETVNTTVAASQRTASAAKAPPGSIRSMIMKKSIFNSDSESEEDDDALFGTMTKSVPTAGATVSISSGQIAKLDVDKCGPTETPEFNGAVVNNESPPVPENSAVTLYGALEQKEIRQESSKDGNTLDVSNQPPNSSGDETQLTTKNSYKDHAVCASEETGNKQTDEPPSTTVQGSIFEDLSLENESDVDLGKLVGEFKNSGMLGSLDWGDEPAKSVEVNREGKLVKNKIEQTTGLKGSLKDDGDASEVSLKSSQLNLNRVAPDEAHNAPKLPFSDPVMDVAEIPDDHDPCPSIVPAEVTPLSRDEPPPPLGMIANDIDYFLRTNKHRPVTPPPAVKSEPKSALNFSPIGLFDDVPPPDDEGEVYAHEQQKHFHPVDSGSSLPPVDEAPAYPTESQSLNFIPNGSSAGRARYLFDDEPPPDEADNTAPGVFGEPYSFRGASTKVSPVKDRQADSVAPMSLPPMTTNDTARAAPRPKINKLNAKIAINVAALLPGARRSPAATVAPVKPIVDIAVEEPHEATSARPTQAGQTCGDKLASLNKGRARIPTKRKPPSRQTLRAAVSAEAEHQTDVISLGADDRIVLGSEQKILHIEGVQSAKQLVPSELPIAVEEPKGSAREVAQLMDPLVVRLSASVRNHPSARVASPPDGNEKVVAPVISDQQAPRQPDQMRPTSIFGDSDEGDDTHLFGGKQLPPGLQASVKAPVLRSQPASKSNARSIFGSDDDDDEEDDNNDAAVGTVDIFGAKKATIASHLKTSKPTSRTATISVKPPPPKGPTSLFGDDDSGSDDSDDLFGGKTKILTKPPGLQPTGKSITTTTTSKAANVTRTVNDPLADLLDS